LFTKSDKFYSVRFGRAGRGCAERDNQHLGRTLGCRRQVALFRKFMDEHIKVLKNSLSSLQILAQ